MRYQPVSQNTIAKFGNQVDAVDYWYRLSQLLVEALGPPCIDALELEEQARNLVPEQRPEDRFTRIWRLGPDRLALGVQEPSAPSLGWSTHFLLAPHRPTYRVAPDGSRTELPEPECASSRQ